MDSKLKLKVLAALPNDGAQKAFAQVTSSLSELAKSDLAAFCSVPAQKALSCVQDIVVGMEQAVSPDIVVGKGDDFFASVMDRLALIRHLRAQVVC